jgi:hypothetical protein
MFSMVLNSVLCCKLLVFEALLFIPETSFLSSVCSSSEYFYFSNCASATDVVCRADVISRTKLFLYHIFVTAANHIFVTASNNIFVTVSNHIFVTASNHIFVTAFSYLLIFYLCSIFMYVHIYTFSLHST